MSIVLKDVSYIYSRKTSNEYKALNEVNFTINDGDFLTLVGKTGSGKSTIIQLLNGLSIPTSGEVLIDGISTKNICKKNKTTKQLRKKVGVVFQFPEYQLFEETIEKDVAFGLVNYGMKQDEAIKKAHEYILQVGLDESYFTKSPFEISGGERRKVAIAGILALDPEILVLDEPTAGLDPKSKADLLEFIEDLHQKGKTIIVVTHTMQLVLKYSNHVVMINDGEVLFDGAPKDFFMDERVSKYIVIPESLEVARRLINKGAKIDISKVTSTDSLLKQIKRWRSKNG